MDGALKFSSSRSKSLLGEITVALRLRTMARFPLPEDETFEVHFVKDQPWSGYNWYLGGCRSRIDINTDLPLRIADPRAVGARRLPRPPHGTGKQGDATGSRNVGGSSTASP